MLDPNESHTRLRGAAQRLVSDRLEQATEGFHQRLLRLFDGFYDKVDDAFHDLADKAESDSAYAGYFTAMRLFRKRRPASRLAFVRSLRHAHEGFAKATNKGPRPLLEGDEQAWRPTGRVEPEETLVLENMVSKSTSRYRAVLEDLGRALGLACGLRQVPIAANPFGPGAICAAFETALVPFSSIEAPVKLVVYKLFDKEVMDRLGEVYAATLENLSSGAAAAGGGAASAVNQPTPRAREAQSGDPPRLSQPPARRGATGTPAPSGTSGLERIHQRLLPAHRSPDIGPGRVAPSELLAALNRIQPFCPPLRDRQTRASWLRARLNATLGLEREAGPRRQLRDQDQASVELVVRLFEQILASAMLPAAIKPLIARLEVPILKVVLLDKGFLRDPDHPATRLLNRAGQAALGWTDDGDRSAASLYGLIAAAVSEVVDGFGEDVAAFAEADARLAAALATRIKAARTWEDRARQVAEGRARAKSSEQVAAAVIRDRLHGYEKVPPIVVTLLEEGWSRVLAGIYLHDGRDTEAWREGLAMVDRLLWSVCPKVTAEERRELLHAIPSLLRKLRVALAESSAEPRKVSTWFRELQVLHMSALRGDGDSGPIIGVGRDRQASSLAPQDPMRPDPESLPSKVPAGSWVELDQGGERRARFKLVWQDLAGERLLLVDASRRKGLDLHAGRMASMIGQGRAVVVGHEDQGLLEQAVAAMTRPLEGT